MSALTRRIEILEQRRGGKGPSIFAIQDEARGPDLFWFGKPYTADALQEIADTENRDLVILKIVRERGKPALD